MVWDFSCDGLKTDIPVTDWPHLSATQYFHSVHHIVATSQPKGKGEIEIDIRRVSICPTDQRDEILRRLSSERHWTHFRGFDGQGTFTGPIRNKEHSSYFALQFDLGKDQHFCDIALDTVRDIFRHLSMEDPTHYQLANFSMAQETLVYADGEWISFASWLRMTIAWAFYLYKQNFISLL
ncbi:MAG: hypothetical protein K0S38_844 [Candidatus Paceibacter sp.]|nr:hypothetical protein [Candidatus Paceibacter sp.]